MTHDDDISKDDAKQAIQKVLADKVSQPEVVTIERRMHYEDIAGTIEPSPEPIELPMEYDPDAYS